MNVVSHKLTHRIKIAKELPFLRPKKNYLFKIPTPPKKAGMAE
jgi:hypothetical protein